MNSGVSEIQALLDTRVDASKAKDIDRLMALYSPGIVYYDVVPPLHFTGIDEVRRNFQRWFDEYDGPIGLETHELDITAGEDVAFARMLHVDSGTRKDSVPQGAIWLRSTVCLQRSDGKWLITHEHISLPLGWAESPG